MAMGGPCFGPESHQTHEHSRMLSLPCLRKRKQMVNEVDVRKYAELGKMGHMKEDNRRKRCVGSKCNAADFKDKILREFSKGFPRDRKQSHMRCDKQSRHVASQQ